MKEIYQSNSHRMAKQIIAAVNRVKSVGGRIFVFPHKSVDGDCIGSSTTIVTILRKLGAEAYIAMPETLPANMAFLEIEDLIKYPAEDANEWHCDIAFAVDCSEGHRMGKTGELFEATEDKLIIDHHELDITGDNIWIVPSASSASELCFYVAQALAEETGKDVSFYIDRVAARACLSGLVTDTGRFTYSNTKPETLVAAGELMELGGDISTTCYELFDKKTVTEFKISNQAYLDSEFVVDGKMAITTVDKATFEKFNAAADDISEVVSKLRDVAGVEFACVLRELDDGGIRANLRSKAYFDCCEFARSFGGGGHIRAAGFTVEGYSLSDLKNEIVRKATALL